MCDHLRRSARVIKYGLRYHSEKQNSEYWWKKWVAEKQDLNLITMVESTLEAFPQLVLHLYVIRIEIVQDCPTSIFQWGKVFLSAGALSLAMAMFKDNQVLKDDDQNYEMPKTVPVIIVSFLWHSMTILGLISVCYFKIETTGNTFSEIISSSRCGHFSYVHCISLYNPWRYNHSFGLNLYFNSFCMEM